MKTLLAVLFALSVGCGGLSPSVRAQTEETAPKPPEEHAPDPGGRRPREFMGDDLGQVFRLLARQGKINLAIGENVKGSATVRLENVTALEAIEVLVHQYKLTMTRDDKGVYYINAPESPVDILELLAKPEVAAQIAAYKRNLYDALVKQGFAPNDALQLIGDTDLGSILTLLARKPEPAPNK